MEMSLDDIIKQNRPRRGGTGTRRGIGSKFVDRRGGSSARKPGGTVMRGRSRGGISRSFGRSTSFNGSTSYNRSTSFNRSTAPKRSFLGSSPNRKFTSSNYDSTKLIVSNLDFGVTDSDILELFSEFGPLKSAGVHYDRSGRSLGSADLIFERRSDAIKAMKQYNGVPLDGREMNIQLATSDIPNSSPTRRLGTSSTFRGRGSFRGSRGRSPIRGRRGVGKPRGGGRPEKKAPTAEELDAELEEYVKSKVSNSEGA